MESRVAAERIEGGVGFQEGNIRGAVLNRFVEGFQRLVFVADESRENADSIVTWRKFSFVLLLFQDCPLRLQNPLPARVLIA